MSKLKLDTKRIAAIVIGVIMLGSTFAFALLSVFNPTNQQQSEIPEERILNYKLTNEQARTILQNGLTLVEYSYSENCIECLEVKNVLEDATNNAEKQIFLQEIISNNVSANSVTILNAYTQTAKILKDPKVDNVTLEVCQALTSPTVWCLRGV